MQLWFKLSEQIKKIWLRLRRANWMPDIVRGALGKIASFRPVQWMRKDRKHLVVTFSVLALLVIVLSVCLAVVLGSQTLREPGFGLVGDNLVMLMKGQKTTATAQNIQIRSFGSGSKLESSHDGHYSIRSTDGGKYQIADGFPVFTNQGASIYLYNSRFLLISTGFKTEKTRGSVYISGGKIYNASQRQVGNGSVLLVRLPNGLYVNTQSLTIQTTAQSVTVPLNSVLGLEKNAISVMTPSDGKRKIIRMPVSGGVAVIGTGKKTFGYETFLKNIGAGSSVSHMQVTVPEDVYQYSMGERYDFTGEKTLYTASSGVFLSWMNEISRIGSQPLYYEKGNKLIIPSDYVVVQPQFASMYKLPALSQVFSDTLATYTKSASRVNTYVKMFLFNGSDTYIFPTGAELHVGGQAITLMPYSSVSMGRDGTVGIYQLGQKYFTLRVGERQSVTAKTGDSSTLSLSENVLTFSMGQKMMLFQKPSMLQEENQKKK